MQQSIITWLKYFFHEYVYVYLGTGVFLVILFLLHLIDVERTYSGLALQSHIGELLEVFIIGLIFNLFVALLFLFILKVIFRKSLIENIYDRVVLFVTSMLVPISIYPLSLGSPSPLELSGMLRLLILIGIIGIFLLLDRLKRQK